MTFAAICHTCRTEWPSATEAGALVLPDHHAEQHPGHVCSVAKRKREHGSGDALLLLLVALLVAFVVLGVFAMLRTAAGQTCANNPGICKEIQR